MPVVVVGIMGGVVHVTVVISVTIIMSSSVRTVSVGPIVTMSPVVTMSPIIVVPIVAMPWLISMGIMRPRPITLSGLRMDIVLRMRRPMTGWWHRMRLSHSMGLHSCPVRWGTDVLLMIIRSATHRLSLRNLRNPTHDSAHLSQIIVVISMRVLRRSVIVDSREIVVAMIRIGRMGTTSAAARL